MNKFFKTTTALLTLSALVACGEDAAMDESLNLSNGKMLESISITGKDFQTEAGTRSTVQIDNAGVKFLWAENDTVGIFPNSGSQAEFIMAEGASTQTATFNGGGWALKHSATYSAYYPYNFYNPDLTKIPVSYAKQHQTGNASTAHLGAYDFMAASVATPSNGAVAFDMQHMGALVMLQANLDEAKTLTGVTLKANAEVFTTTGTMDLSVVNPSIAAKTTTSTLSLPLNDFTISASETSTIYFMMAPANLLGETLEVTLSDEKGSYIKYEVAGKNFVAGTAYAYALIDGALMDGEKTEVLIPQYAVDLGLPSGTFWADRNVGADAPEAYGDYFAYGETEPKDVYGWNSYKWCYGSKNTQHKYCTSGTYGIVDGKTMLEPDDDAAYVNMGSEWCIPTSAEWVELFDNCIQNWTIQNGVGGRKLISKHNGNSIFLPAAWYSGGGSNSTTLGVYWSSSLNEENSSQASALYFHSGVWYCSYNRDRYIGQSVRAVVRQEK